MIGKLVKALSAAGRHEEATRRMRSWLDEHPDDLAVRQFLGMAYQSTGQKKKAIEEYEKILARNPEDPVVLNNLAWLYLKSDASRALELAEGAYRISQDDPGIQDTYGWILVQQGEVEKGRRLLKKALEKMSDNPDVRFHYAVALSESGETEKSRQMLEQLLRDGKPFESREEAEKLLGK